MIKLNPGISTVCNGTLINHSPLNLWSPNTVESSFVPDMEPEDDSDVSLTHVTLISRIQHSDVSSQSKRKRSFCQKILLSRAAVKEVIIKNSVSTTSVSKQRVDTNSSNFASDAVGTTQEVIVSSMKSICSVASSISDANKRRRHVMTKAFDRSPVHNSMTADRNVNEMLDIKTEPQDVSRPIREEFCGAIWDLQDLYAINTSPELFIF